MLMNRLRPFEDFSCSPRAAAMAQLEKRTHYVDADTLRYFNARIVRAGVFGELPEHPGRFGLFGLVESIPVFGDQSRREFRAVLFDIGGTVLHREESGSGWRTSAQAWRELERVASEVDVPATIADASRKLVEWAEYYSKAAAELVA